MACPVRLHAVVEEATHEFRSDLACELFEAFRGEDHPFFLDGGCDPARLGRYSIIGSRPDLVLRSRGLAVEVESDGSVAYYTCDPLKKLDEILSSARLDYSGPLPFAGGAVGYLGYGLSRFTAGVETRADDTGAPDMEVGFYRSAAVFDNLEGRVWLVSSGADDDECAAGLKRLRESFNRAPQALLEAPPHPSGYDSSFTKAGYLAAVGRVKDYIRSGDTYQVNISQRFSVEAVSEPWQLYKRLRTMNPAPFSAYLGFGETAVLSSSPERFLEVSGRRIETRPIKGTRPRGKDDAADLRLALELRSSAKDGAEHVMIVDLERNDLGRVSEWGSVRVPEFEALESYATVHHLVSTVEGRLRDGVSLVDSVRACFPGGSITGAPKVRSMEIIDELEPVARGLYTGSVGYLGFNGRMDLNIAIRTMVCRGGGVFFSVGGGIVADSEGESEYEETLDKGRAIFQSLGIIV